MTELLPGVDINTLSQNQRIYAAATSPSTPIELRRAIAHSYSKRVNLDNI